MHDSYDLSQFDLNLLRALQALVSELSVTRAAKQLGVTQPAMSRSLGRLRETLGDPLLVRSGRGFVPTPRAEELLVRAERVLAEVGRMLSEPEAFEPSTATRSFRITSADFFTYVALPTVMQRVLATAPGVDVVLVSSTRPEADLESGWLDAAIAPSGAIVGPELMRARLFDEHFLVMMRRGHPALREAWTPALYASLQHVLVAPGGRPGGTVDSFLAQRGLERRVRSMVPGFAAVPPVIAGSDLITTLPSRLARAFATTFDLEVLPLPFPGPGFGLDLFWHARFDADPAHRWWRSLLRTLE